MSSVRAERLVEQTADKGEQPLLSVAGVSLGYKRGKNVVQAVKSISFDVNKGERLVLLGPSGCGKTTLLRAIAGFMQPLGGKVLVGGKEVDQPGPDRAVVFQEFDQLLPWRKVLSNVSFPLMVNGCSKAEAKDIAVEYLNIMGLSSAINLYPHELSGGMKQRVAIARAMSLKPTVLLMDEPFGALDAQTRARLQVQLRDITREANTTLIFVTHSITEAIVVGTKIVMLTQAPSIIQTMIEPPPDAAYDQATLHRLQTELSAQLTLAQGEETSYAFYE